MACLCKSTSVQVALRAFQVPKTCQIHCLHDRQGDFFVKMARRPAAAMFQGEALGLEALRGAGWGTKPKKAWRCHAKGHVQTLQPVFIELYCSIDILIHCPRERLTLGCIIYHRSS